MLTTDEDFPHPPRLTLPPRGGDLPPVPQAGTLTIIDIALSGRALDVWQRAALAASLPVDVHRVSDLDPETWWDRRHAVFAEVAAGRVVGWHLALCGPEYAVLALQAAAFEAGLLPVEVLIHSDPDPRRFVYCPHCTRVQLVDSRSSIVCAGCRNVLHIHEHFNRARGYFLASVTGQP